MTAGGGLSELMLKGQRKGLDRSEAKDNNKGYIILLEGNLDMRFRNKLPYLVFCLLVVLVFMALFGGEVSSLAAGVDAYLPPWFNDPYPIFLSIIFH